MRQPGLWWGIAGLIASVSWAQACATTTANQATLAANPRPPFPPAAPLAKPASGEPLGQPIALTDFQPLLSLPELAGVAQAVDSERYAQAAVLLSDLVSSGARAEDGHKLQFLLGRLREKAGDVDGAIGAYRASCLMTWELSPYIALSLGRLLLQRGDASGALQELKRVPAGLVVTERAQLLTAQAAQRTKDFDLATNSYRAYLSKDPKPPDFAGTAVNLARSLLDRAVYVAGDPQRQQADRVEALQWARRARWAPGGSDVREQARILEERSLASMAAPERHRHAALSLEEQLAALSTLVDSNQFSDAEIIARDLLSGMKRADKFSDSGCEAQLLRAKALAGLREWGKAADMLSDTTRLCQNTDLRVRGLFMAGKFAFADKRYSAAVRYFEQLEQLAPQHRLADDARLKAALAYLEMGVEARYTALLLTMPADYPEGDMVLDGVFALAMRRIEKGDWTGAASVLDGAAEVAREQDKRRGTEYSGRERYFRARAWMEIGETERALSEFEALVRELPLSYYMLHAYTRLKLADPARAAAARAAATLGAEEQPFDFAYQPEFDSPGFQRALELLRQGEVLDAEAELSELGLLSDGTTPAVLWAVALLYDRAGAAKLSHKVARGLLTDWLQRWPAGDWRRAWELAFPRPFLSDVEQMAKKNDIPPALIYGVMREESQFDESIVSHAGAHGLMQLMPATARHYGKKAGLPHTEAALRRPANNIALGALVLKSFQRPFPEDPLLCIPAYNAGPGRPKRWRREHPNVDFDVWVELIPFRETRRYTHRVIASRAAYGYLYADSGEDDSWLTLPVRLSELHL